MNVADYVIEFLENKGIEHCFTVSGGGSIFLCDALARAKRMKYVCTHHEQAAAYAAEAYARVRNSLGFCLVTSGPGGTNAISGCASSWLDSVPVLFVSGQAFLHQTIKNHPGLRQKGVQEINIVDLVKPITKYAVMVENAADIKYHLQAAWSLMNDKRMGPAWIDIPGDIQNASC